jgi:hypothetical protein
MRVRRREYVRRWRAVEGAGWQSSQQAGEDDGNSNEGDRELQHADIIAESRADGQRDFKYREDQE